VSTTPKLKTDQQIEITATQAFHEDDGSFIYQAEESGTRIDWRHKPSGEAQYRQSHPQQDISIHVTGDRQLIWQEKTPLTEHKIEISESGIHSHLKTETYRFEIEADPELSRLRTETTDLSVAQLVDRNSTTTQIEFEHNESLAATLDIVGQTHIAVSTPEDLITMSSKPGQSGYQACLQHGENPIQTRHPQTNGYTDIGPQKDLWIQKNKLHFQAIEPENRLFAHALQSETMHVQHIVDTFGNWYYQNLSTEKSKTQAHTFTHGGHLNIDFYEQSRYYDVRESIARHCTWLKPALGNTTASISNLYSASHVYVEFGKSYRSLYTCEGSSYGENEQNDRYSAGNFVTKDNDYYRNFMSEHREDTVKVSVSGEIQLHCSSAEGMTQLSLTQQLLDTETSFGNTVVSTQFSPFHHLTWTEKNSDRPVSLKLSPNSALQSPPLAERAYDFSLRSNQVAHYENGSILIHSPNTKLSVNVETGLLTKVSQQEQHCTATATTSFAEQMGTCLLFSGQTLQWKFEGGSMFYQISRIPDVGTESLIASPRSSIRRLETKNGRNETSLFDASGHWLHQQFSELMSLSEKWSTFGSYAQWFKTDLKSEHCQLDPNGNWFHVLNESHGHRITSEFSNAENGGNYHIYENSENKLLSFFNQNEYSRLHLKNEDDLTLLFEMRHQIGAFGKIASNDCQIHCSLGDYSACTIKDLIGNLTVVTVDPNGIVKIYCENPEHTHSQHAFDPIQGTLTNQITRPDMPARVLDNLKGIHVESYAMNNLKTHTWNNPDGSSGTHQAKEDGSISLHLRLENGFLLRGVIDPNGHVYRCEISKGVFSEFAYKKNSLHPEQYILDHQFCSQHRQDRFAIQYQVNESESCTAWQAGHAHTFNHKLSHENLETVQTWKTPTGTGTRTIEKDKTVHIETQKQGSKDWEFDQLPNQKGRQFLRYQDGATTWLSHTPDHTRQLKRIRSQENIAIQTQKGEKTTWLSCEDSHCKVQVITASREYTEFGFDPEGILSFQNISPEEMITHLRETGDGAIHLLSQDEKGQMTHLEFGEKHQVHLQFQTQDEHTCDCMIFEDGSSFYIFEEPKGSLSLWFNPDGSASVKWQTPGGEGNDQWDSEGNCSGSGVGTLSGSADRGNFQIQSDLDLDLVVAIDTKEGHSITATHASGVYKIIKNTNGIRHQISENGQSIDHSMSPAGQTQLTFDGTWGKGHLLQSPNGESSQFSYQPRQDLEFNRTLSKGTSDYGFTLADAYTMKGIISTDGCLAIQLLDANGDPIQS